MLLSQYAANHPTRALIALFCCWKALLLAVAVGSCVGPTYDTSSALLLEASAPVGLVARLASWDAIYYLQIASRGYLFEQEWAFGAGLPIVVSFLGKGLDQLLPGTSAKLSLPVLAILVAHLSHLLSVLVLYRLGKLIWRDDRLSLIAASLHILSPAGLFLSAPYSESSFALLAFVGYYLYARARLCCDGSPFYASALQLFAGVAFGLATAFRSNGILNGIPFAYDALQAVARLANRKPDLPTLVGLISVGLGGVCVAAGTVIPQAVAYQRFCSEPSEASPRPWCSNLPPGIYSFVQGHYWVNGLFRYWTVSNLPLFIIAAPMLLVLARSGVDTFSHAGRLLAASTDGSAAEKGDQQHQQRGRQSQQLLPLVRCMAGAQVLLALLVVTNNNVQIITRLSSGYPIWYWWLARSLLGWRASSVSGGIVMFIAMYALIQAVLFASFLPPA